MADDNGERMRSIEDHERMERNIDGLRASLVEQKENVDKLLGALRDLIDRIPPENLRPTQ